MSVVNIRSGDRYDIRIDRKSCWGNPYIVSRDGTLRQCLELYKLWMLEQVVAGLIMLEGLAALRGLRLGCHCAPAPCHGDVLEELAEWSYHLLARRFG